MNEERLDCLLRHLLAVINRDVIKRRFARRGRRAVSKSRHALIIHAFASEAGVSAIEPPTATQDGVFEGVLEFLDAIHFRPRFHPHVLGHSQLTKTTMRPLGGVDGGFVAVRHDDQQVNVAVVMRSAPRVRAEKPDLVGFKFRDESLRRRRKQTVAERFHGAFLAQDSGN